ncbi:gasdermin-D [Saccopteryx leptura]|uniref:gasdermin-D n=1 Tax=Saccopteryx leptura TaxID=249018 RepID=UPI00339D1CBB
MASAFEKVVKSVVRELDHSRELVPVNSLQRSTSFQPYCLLSRKSAVSRFWTPRYTSLNVSITDILEPNTPAPAVELVGPFHFQDTVDGHLEGKLELAAPGQGKLAGGAAVSGSSSASMTVCTLRVPSNAWVAMIKERSLQQPEHKILQELRDCGDDVFVVTEVLQTQKEVEVTRTHKQQGSGQFALPGAVCFQGQGEGHLSRKKTVTIPSGSVLAFRANQLVICSSGWNILLVSNKKKRTFEPPQKGNEDNEDDAGRQPRRPLADLLRMWNLVERLKFLSDGIGEDEPSVPSKEFQELQEEVKVYTRALEDFSKTLCQQLRSSLGQVLGDESALQALEESLEQALCYRQAEPLPGPAGDVLECLVLPSRTLVKDLACPILYLLQALAALSETQHVLLAEGLLAEGLEASALLEPFKLVESVLEKCTSWQERRALSLPPGLLGSSWGSEVPAWILLEACGLELQVDAPQVCWTPEAQGSTCALYASLALLLKLSQHC